MSPSVPVNCASRFISGVGGVVKHMDLEPKSHEIKMKTLGVNFLLAPHPTRRSIPSRPSIHLLSAPRCYIHLWWRHAPAPYDCDHVLSFHLVTGMDCGSFCQLPQTSKLLQFVPLQCAVFVFIYLTSLSSPSFRSSSSLSIQMCLSPSLSSQDCACCMCTSE